MLLPMYFARARHSRWGVLDSMPEDGERCGQDDVDESFAGYDRNALRCDQVEEVLRTSLVKGLNGLRRAICGQGDESLIGKRAAIPS